MQTLRNKSKYKGLKRILFSIKYSIDGLVYAYGNEKSLLLHGVLSTVLIILGLFFHISKTKWILILITLAVILAIELVNTAIEAVVDMYTTKFNPLAKIAKDCGSAATFVLVVVGAIISGSIYIPLIINLFK
jgi:undecaprenol kinase